MAECPVCGSDVELPVDIIENEIMDCDTCSAELDILSVNPIKLEEAPEEQEDWGE